MKKRKNNIGVTISLIIFVFLIMLVSSVLVGSIIFIFYHFGVLERATQPSHARGLFKSLLVIFLLSLTMGTILTALLSKRSLKPYKKVINTINEVAKGNFDVTLEFERGPYELHEISASFNQMTAELRGTEALRNDFINHFSHEFKTPIVSIRGFAKLLQNPELDEEKKQHYLQTIIQESTRLSNLSSTILKLTKVENTEIVSEKKVIQLDEQLRQVLLILEPKWQEKKLELDLELASVKILANEELLQQVWINLIDNAIKFSSEKGLLTISLIEKEQSVEVDITDNGIGMSEALMAHMYDKFYQGDSSHQKEGYGLGLPLVKRIVDLCEGEIEINSTEKLGTTVSIRLKKNG